MLRSLISGARALLHPVKRNAQIQDELKSFFEAPWKTRCGEA